MKLSGAKFVTSMSSYDPATLGQTPEICFVGRSNVGKSSLINMICERNGLARTSQTPGRTRLINVFELNFADPICTINLIDLPGYGFAGASKSTRQKWGKMIEKYLLESPNLRLVCALVDSRHPPSQLDCTMARYLYAHTIPFCVVATKSDKLPRSQRALRRRAIAAELGIGESDVTMTSADDRTGREDLYQILLDAAMLSGTQ